MHIAGHQHCGDYIIDTHDRKVVQDVWKLFNLAWQLTGGVATLLEWDNHIPEFEDYHAELLKARKYMSGLVMENEITSKEDYELEAAVSNPVDFMVNVVVSHES